MDLCNSSLSYFEQKDINLLTKKSRSKIKKILNNKNTHTNESTNSWIINIYEYLHKVYSKNNMFEITDIIQSKIDDKDKINVLKLLKIFCTDRHDYILEELNIDKKYLDKIIKLLIQCLEKQSKNGKLSKQLKYNLRHYIEINDKGKKLLELFFKHLLNTNIIHPDYRLLFNPYTSIINLNEIYLQTKYKYVINVKLNKGFLSNKTNTNKINTNKINTNKINTNDIYFNNRIIIFTPNEKELGKLFNNNPKNNQDKNPVKKKSKKPNIISYESEYLKELISRCFLFNYILQNGNFPTSMILYLIDYKKEMMQVKNKKDIIFTPSEINTGVTNGQQIIITRFEEALKTIIHELIHFHDLDFKNVPKFLTDYCLQKFQLEETLKDHFNNPVINLFEAYTEGYASIINCIYYTYLNPSLEYNLQENTELKNYEIRINKYLGQHLTYQIAYTMIKCCQILNIIGCKDLNQFTNNKTLNGNNRIINSNHKTINGNSVTINSNNVKKCKIGLNENTNVFSYYFIKLYFYLYLDELFNNCCQKYNGKFIKNKENYYQLKNIIEKGRNNKYISDLVITLQNNLSKQNNSSKQSNKHKNPNKNKKNVINKLSYNDSTLKMVCLA